jgi:digeranylgeranylglycerophospholipid reductase
MPESFDVVIIGSGPAGSSTARYAAEAGLSVVMIERRTKVGEPVQCGEFVPGPEETNEIFHKCGDLGDMFEVPDSIICKHTDEILVHSPKGKIFRVPFKGFSVERKDFDKFLVDRALEAGAVLKTSTHAKGLNGDVVNTTQGEFSGKVIVGADGPLCRVGGWVGLKGPTTLCPCILAEIPGEFNMLNIWGLQIKHRYSSQGDLCLWAELYPKPFRTM